MEECKLKKIFTLIELVVVLAIIGIGASLFYSVFLLNWISFESQIAQANLWQEAQLALQKISFDVRVAKEIDITNKSITLTFPDNSTLIYTITPSGELQRIQTETISVISDKIDYNSSCFHFESEDCSVEETADNVKSLKIFLTLSENVFNREIKVTTSTQIFCRNRL